MARLDSFLRVALDQRVSDLHVHAGKPPIVRLDGDLLPLPFRVLTPRDAKLLIEEILDPEQRATLEREQQVDLMYVLADGARFRANAFVQGDGLSAVFRAIPSRIPTLEELRLPNSVRELTLATHGLVLVTGPTGSGKTTTLAAMIQEINLNSARHVVMLEDPVEFVHASANCVVTQRQVGRDVVSFAEGLRSAMRESPDVLVVGELRDYESVALALHAAETGVLVLGTLHSTSAAGAVDRILDTVAEEGREQARGLLSVLLRGVVAQTLCRRASGTGRVAAHEILLHSHAVANLVREGKLHQLDSYLSSSSGRASGAQSLDDALFAYARDGLVARDEALRLARAPESLAERLAALPVEP